ncbi:hypothetical protein FIBSPDRAFT_891611 [Athelia psychrophila]|uniref:Glucose-methanol-choline oxidoreductase N-terminal domain-containing protein n=1 Tax=Athelia psychrophila TaxID=1759441 RepID=A0A166JE13_9AGAM|nr:hypothetical protein FIBSPDRAFT_891611 [Fibularhizoctonia sp. CBS 109695]
MLSAANYRTWYHASLLNRQSHRLEFYYRSKTINGQKIKQPRGFCLGGTSSIKGLTYGRESASIYNNWEKLGNPGWNWSNISEYFQKADSGTTTAPLLKSTNAFVNAMSAINIIHTDASIFPIIPDQHPSIMVYMTAEKGAQPPR